MEIKTRKQHRSPWLGLLYGILIVMILNSFVFPYILGNKVVETDYGTFIDYVNKGEVHEVNIDNNYILFSVKENDSLRYFKTGAIDDPQLVDRLLKAKSSNTNGKIVFNKHITEENSPLVNFLLM